MKNIDILLSRWIAGVQTHQQSGNWESERNATLTTQTHTNREQNRQDSTGDTGEREILKTQEIKGGTAETVTTRAPEQTTRLPQDCPDGRPG